MFVRFRSVDQSVLQSQCLDYSTIYAKQAYALRIDNTPSTYNTALYWRKSTREKTRVTLLDSTSMHIYVDMDDSSLSSSSGLSCKKGCFKSSSAEGLSS